MIVSWMLFALALGALFTVAAFAAERVLKGSGQPVRFVWTAAMALSVLWPIAPAVARLLPTAPQPVNVLPFTIVVSSPYMISADEAAALARAALIDRALLAVWIVSTLLLAARLVHGSMRLTTSRRAWKRGRVNGVRVQISDNIGPAVVGLRQMEVVVPEWILSLEESLRAIVLRHEEEHRLARDPYLLFGASVLMALMPWNVALWIQARRLRLAIEMDCDRRVLRAHPSPERYGMLILTIAQRKSLAPALFAPMLSEPKTNLERRILAMRTTKVARATVIGGGLVTVSVLALASSLQSAPTSFAQTRAAIAQRFVAALPAAFAPETIPVTARTPATSSAPATQGAVSAPTKQEVRKLNSVVVTAVDNSGFANPAPRYPALLRAGEVEGAVVARFSYDDRGSVDANSISIVTTTNGNFSDAVIAALKSWHGAPKTSVQVPFVFVLSTKSGKDLAAYPGGLPAGSVVVNATPLSEADVQRVVAAATGEPKPVDASATFFEFQVEQPVTPVPGNRGPRYPDDLREARVEGEVLAQFIVDAEGHADMASFKVLKSEHDQFTAAVLSVLPDMKFNAARVGGRPVKQLVQMPFQFNLAK